MVVIRFETLIEPKPGSQRIAADEGGRLIACRPQYLGQRHIVVAKRIADVQTSAVSYRIGPGQHRAVCRQSHGNGRDRRLEQNSVPSQRIDVRRRLGRVAVATQVVGTTGVDANKHDVADASDARMDMSETPNPPCGRNSRDDQSQPDKARMATRPQPAQSSRFPAWRRRW